MSSFDPYEYLNSFTNFESRLHKLHPDNFTLDRIKKLLSILGNPEKNLKIIHIAGTKGKGSTCIFMASILHYAGYKVGLYTSPHLHKVKERIRILDQDNIRSKEQFFGSISDEKFSVILGELRPHINKIIEDGEFLTYFEVLTVAALIYFVQSKVDFVILETGLGGRLDATNAIPSMMAIITPVSLDHTKILGSTLAEIGFEKAGIIKNTQQQVMVAPQEKEVVEVIKRRCREFDIIPTFVDMNLYKDLKTALKGDHQTINAATALTAVEALIANGYKISQEAISEGLKNVQWAGRFEVIQENPAIILDCAHNAASAKALARTVIDVYPYRRVILVLGVSSDKDVKTICAHLKDTGAQIILTRANHPRAHDFTEDEAKQYFHGKIWSIVDNVPDAMAEALKLAKKEDIVLVTGSVFMVAQATEYIRSLK